VIVIVSPRRSGLSSWRFPLPEGDVGSSDLGERDQHIVGPYDVSVYKILAAVGQRDPLDVVVPPVDHV
jgi:hypothetical protein